MKKEFGKWYNIPCVQLNEKHAKKNFINLEWIPVIGHWHSEKKFAKFLNQRLEFLEDDIHIDWRFIPAENRTICRPGAILEHEVVSKDFKYFNLQYLSNLPMQREESIEVYRKTLLAMKPDTKMKYMKCPHQGYDMSDCDIVAGVVQCPLHGLKWNVQMGESVQ